MPAPQSPSLRARAFARRHFPVALLLLLAAASLGAVLSASLRKAEAVGRDGERGAEEVTAQSPPDPADAYGKLPLQFEANRGQTDERVRFVSRGDGYVMFLAGDEAVLALDRGAAVDTAKATAKASEEKQGYSVLRMKLAGASASPKVEGLEELPGKVNYFVGREPSEWRTNVPVYARVHYTSVYPGIDLVYYGNQRELEYDFQVAPGADPRAIKLKFEGVERAAVDEKDGGLSLFVGGGKVRMKRPVIYQLADDGSRREIEGGYKVKGREVEFNVGRYDTGRPLVIDPVLSYSTFLGTLGNISSFSGASLALDPTGAAYVTGGAGSLAFPAPGVKQIWSTSGSSNVFVTKLNPSGTALVYTSYLGGFSDDVGLGVALDPTGAAYVTGKTNSSEFPTTANALRANDDLLKSTDGGATWQRSGTGLQERPVTRMSADPSSASTLYAVAPFIGHYKTTDGGATWNQLNTGLKTTSNPFSSAFAIAPSNTSILYAGNEGSSAKVARSADGGATWTKPANAGLPGTSITGLGVDPANPNVVYAGTTFEVFKSTDGGANWTTASAGINFVGVTSFLFDPANTSVVYALAGGNPLYKSTNGGASWTQVTTGISPTIINAVVMDPSNSSTLYAATSTGVYKSTNAAGNWTQVNTGLTNLAVRSLACDPNAPSTVYAGTTKGGVFKTTNGGATWTQVHNGLGRATVLALAVSASSQVYAGVDTRFGVSVGLDSEAFFSKLSPAGDALVYSTYLGGEGNDEGDAIAVNSSGNAYVVGQTASADFPVVGPRASSLQGTSDAFVTKFNAAGDALVFSTLVGGAQAETGRSVALDGAGNAYVCGETMSADFPVTPGAFSTTFSGQQPLLTGNDGFVFKLDSAGSALSYATFLGGNGDDRATDIAVDSSGSAYVTGSTSSSNFPLLNAALPTASGGFNSFNGYATKLNSAGSALVYSTYLGGGLSQSIALDSAGAAYLTGSTSSINFPLTPDTLKTHSPLYRTTDSGASWDNLNFGLSAGSLSGNPGSFHDLVADPLKPGVLYASSDDAVYKSTDGGRNWARASNGITAQRIDALAIDAKNPSTVYAGVGLFSSNTPTVFKTTDGGANWSPLASTSAFQFASVLAVDPSTPANVYAFNGSVVKSTDGGANWNPPGHNSPTSVSSITIDPSNPLVVYASGNGGVFKTTDGGANWAPANNGLPAPATVGRVAIDFAHTATLYANTTGGVYKSTDGGATWTFSLNGVGLSRLIVVDPSDTSTVYAYVGETAGGFPLAPVLYRTDDGGANWLKLTATPNLPLNTLAVDPFTRTNLYVTIDTFSFADTDAFLLKLSPAGNSFAYSTLLGGGGTGPSNSSGTSDQGTAVAVDAQGAAYVAGVTLASDFPVTTGAFLNYNRSGVDLFVSKLVAKPTIGGVVTDASNVPQQGVKITILGAVSGTQLTGADGKYLFTNINVGSNYLVGAAKTGASFTPPAHNLTNVTSDQTADFTLADAATHKIKGRIAEADGATVSGTVVILSGSQVEQTTTDADGNYSFDAPDGGDFLITPVSIAFSFSPSNGNVFGLASDQTVNFTATRHDFVVTNTNDAGGNSLREAITNANATPGKDRISFNIPGAGVHTITLNTALPTIVEPVSIDGSTQPGYAGLPVVEITGASIFSPPVSGPSGAGLTITAGDTLVRALAVNSFNGPGVVLTGGGNNRIEGNIIGLDATGTAARPNKGVGISIQNSSFNVVGGTSPAQRNVISGNTSGGISISSAADNRVLGNYIGTDATGTQTFVVFGGSGNAWGVSVGDGTPLTSVRNVVGGTEPGARNVISGNSGGGVLAAGAGTVVQGNYIGTNAAGTDRLLNTVGVKSTGSNIVIGGTSPAARNVISGNNIGAQLETIFFGSSVSFKGNYVGTDPTGTFAVGNDTGILSNGDSVIGGAEPGAGNVVSGNNHGIRLDCCGPGAATVKGNLVGTDAAGKLPLGNSTGINIQSSQNVGGGTEAGARNVISGNFIGLNVGGLVTPGPSANVFRGNFIGLNAAGDASLPNFGVGVVFNGGSENSLGGDAAGEGNTIAFNRGGGVFVGPAAVNNSFKGNSIFSNLGLGIDLLGATSVTGVTPDDAGDADEGANHLQNFPVVSSFGNAVGSTNVKGTLGSKPSTQYRLDFYSNAACDRSGNGEGARPLGNTLLTTGAAGNATFDVTLAGQLAPGRVVTATATDPSGNTSEFSPCDATAAAGSVEFADDHFDVLEDVGAAVIRVVRTGGSRGALAVNYSTGGGSATAGADYTPVSGTLNFADGETSKTFLVPIVNDNVDETPFTERVTLRLSGAPDLESFGPNKETTLDILDSDTQLFVRVDDEAGPSVPLAEGDFGTKNRVVNVSLSAATGRTITVDFNTLGDTGVAVATPGTDYLPVSGTITFNPGTQTAEINIPVVGDTTDEFDETLTLELKNPTGADVNVSQRNLVIIDDDAPPAGLGH